ncbi:hypothetical protein ILUMI_13256 [Ignelater luminosus]|uniref:phosphoglucomutase (alpha-D-glucose-1,6-bisphosphate-dependent) n=1 Tax=Ignelater luminosus TaxID=2038154 RepID=A0A8K0G602_IGNLU|nr:hypothetical protein ILUMI_13256 [Ignelater luminosus]
MSLESVVVPTTPFEDQKPGTDGLRKKVKLFLEKHYTENYIQCILDALGEKVKGSTLVVGGDGRYFTMQAIRIIIRIASANEVKKLIIGRRGLLSSPAMSGVIRSRNLLGGILLTASHNPGGIRNDFGIKYNIESGGPAPDQLTNKIYDLTKRITQYKLTPGLDCDIQRHGVNVFSVDGRHFEVETVDPVEDYVSLMKSIFDFQRLSNLINGSNNRPPFNVLIDAMNGVTGVYIERILVQELKSDPESIIRFIPLDNFGEVQPNPNLTYAKDLIDTIKADPKYDFGAALDADGDRNMIVGKNGFFVSPSDSLAIIANNLDCIPYFQNRQVRGFARSMPTAPAVDRVAKKLNKELFEVPTGWKYFGNLMDSGHVSLCGEESFGTGSDHVREKDGVWAVLTWLTIIDHKKMSVEDIVREHWKTYGRDYCVRYDYEECDEAGANKLMEHLEKLIASEEIVGKNFTGGGKTYVIKEVDNFSYSDPVDKSVAKKQGIRIVFQDGSRIIFRLSGTISSGATVRIYIDGYEKTKINDDPHVMLRPLIDIALKISKLKNFGRPPKITSNPLSMVRLAPAPYRRHPSDRCCSDVPDRLESPTQVELLAGRGTLVWHSKMGRQTITEMKWRARFFNSTKAFKNFHLATLKAIKPKDAKREYINGEHVAHISLQHLSIQLV